MAPFGHVGGAYLLPMLFCGLGVRVEAGESNC